MRRKLMWGLIGLAVVLMIAIAVLLILQNRTSAPLGEPLSPTALPQQSTPAPPAAIGPGTDAEDVIRYYFDRWNVKDVPAMDLCRIEADRGFDNGADRALEASVTLHTLRQASPEEARAQFDAAWYENPADVAWLLADYTIRYNEAGKELYLRDQADLVDYSFWMVKETQDGSWCIALQGY